MKKWNLNKRFYILILILCLSFIGTNLMLAIEISPPKACDALNTKYDEFAPVWNKYENTLYFNTIRQGYAKFYVADYVEGVFSVATEYRANLNQARNNQSYISFVSENEAVLSTYRQTATRPYMNLHRTHKEKNRFVAAYPIESLSCDGFAGHPSVSPDGNNMVFVSNCFSKDDDTDLLLSQRDPNGNWLEPILLEELNTPGNEITPCLIAEDTLFFASNGMQGPGGYDIYISVKISGRWAAPRPLTDLNTQFDESDPACLPGNMLMFASNRSSGKGGLDLYICNIKHSDDKIIQQGENLELSVMAQTITIRKKSYQEFIMTGYYPQNDLSILDTTCLIDKSIYEHDGVFKKILANGTNIGSISDTVGMMIEHADKMMLKVLYKDSLVIKPSKLTIALNGGPKEYVKDWKCDFVYANDQIKVPVASGNTFPYDTLIDYRQFANEDAFQDSLNIVLTARNSEEQKFVDKLRLTISKSLTTGDAILNQNRQKYYMFVLPVTSKAVAETGLYNPIFDAVLQYETRAKKIELIYFNAQQKETVQNYFKMIHWNGKKKNVKIKKESYKANALYSKGFTDKFIIIKIEIN